MIRSQTQIEETWETGLEMNFANAMQTKELLSCETHLCQRVRQERFSNFLRKSAGACFIHPQAVPRCTADVYTFDVACYGNVPKSHTVREGQAATMFFFDLGHEDQRKDGLGETGQSQNSSRSKRPARVVTLDGIHDHVEAKWVGMVPCHWEEVVQHRGGADVGQRVAVRGPGNGEVCREVVRPRRVGAMLKSLAKTTTQERTQHQASPVEVFVWHDEAAGLPDVVSTRAKPSRSDLPR